MPAKAPCPKCRGQFVELDRGGIKIDVCQECRGVFLDRGELDQIIAAEQRAVSNVYSEDELFFRQLAGQPAPSPPPAPTPQPIQHTAPPVQHTPAPPVQHTPPPPVQHTPPPPVQHTPAPPVQPAQPAYTPPPQQYAHSAPPPQPSHGHQPHGGYHHQQYGFDRSTAERLLGDFRSHQSSHKKKHQKSLLQQLFD